MNLTVDVQCASIEPVPDEDDIRRWIAAALGQDRGARDSEVSVRLVDREEMAQLNLAFRGQNGPTNVLSFPADLPPGLDLALLGDIVVCAPVVAAEAAQQHKTLQAHWAHMIVHGSLHLLGYDHMNDREAAIMEALETRILATMAIPCPYNSNASADPEITSKEHKAP